MAMSQAYDYCLIDVFYLSKQKKLFSSRLFMYAIKTINPSLSYFEENEPLFLESYHSMMSKEDGGDNQANQYDYAQQLSYRSQRSKSKKIHRKNSQIALY